MMKTFARYAALGLCGGLMSLSLGACRQAPYGEAGLSSALLEPARATLGVNVRGEWIWAQASSSDEPVELVVVSAADERKLMYARQFGDRTWSLYPISPTTHAWFARAARDPKAKVASVKPSQIEGLTDAVGWFDGKSVRWLGPAPGVEVVAARWAPKLPAGDRGEPARLREVLEAGLLVDEAGALSALDSNTMIKPTLGFISVEGARSVRAALPLRVLWAAGGEPDLPSLTKLGAVIGAGNGELFKSWRPEYAHSLQADAQPMLRDMIVYHRESSQEPWRVSIQDPWRAQAPVGAVSWPSLLWEPLEVTDKAELDDVSMALYAAWAGWPLTAWAELGALKSLSVHKNKAAPDWRRWELLGAAQRSPWAVGALMEGKTHWSAPDLYTQGQVYLLEGSFDAAAAQARASITAFLKWPRPARDNGIGRSERLLAQALAASKTQGDKTPLAQAMREAARGASYHLAGGDSFAAAQAEREAAHYAAQALLWDEAIFYASKARSRFYHKGLASWCAQVELELAMIHAGAGQLAQAKRYVGYASQRFKTLNDPIGLNRAQLVLAILSQREDSTLSRVALFEQVLSAAKLFVDPYAELMATVELSLYRPFESQEAQARLLTSLSDHLFASRLSIWEQRVWDATALVCAYGRPSDDKPGLQAAREREACERAMDHVIFDRELVQAWRARAFARTQLELDAKPLLVALRAGLATQASREPKLTLPKAAQVTPAQQLMLTVLEQLVTPNRSDDQTIRAVTETLNAYSDPLLSAQLLLSAGVELEERGQEPLARVLLSQAAKVAAEHRQRELWAEATLKSLLLQDRVEGAIEPAALVSARQEAARLGVEPSFMLNLEVFKRYSAGLGDERAALFDDATLSALVFESRLAVLLLAANLAQRHGQWAQAQAHLVRLRRLEAGAPPTFVSSSLGRRLRGESLVLLARQGWQRGELDEVARAVKVAHEVLVEEPGLDAQRLRAEALTWWALISTSSKEDAQIDRELTLMTTPEPNATRHSWRHVMGQRARALVAFDRGQLEASAQALEWLSLQGYALEDAQAFGRGCALAQLKLVQELEADPQTNALQWLRFCANANPPQRIKEHVQLLSAISERSLNAWLDAKSATLDAMTSQEFTTRHAMSVALLRPTRAQDPRRQLTLTTSLDRARNLGTPIDQLEAGLALSDELLATGQLDDARELLVALKPMLTAELTPAPPELVIDYNAARLRYYLLRGRPQDAKLDAAALPTLDDAQQRQATINAALARLQLVQAQQALILGQRQLTRQRLSAALKAANLAKSSELIAQINQMASRLHLSIAPDVEPADPKRPK